MDIFRYTSFADIKHDWKEIEIKVPHSPFQSWWYQNLFASHFSQHANIFLLGIRNEGEIVAIGAFEIIDGIVTVLGTKDVSKKPQLVQDITDFGDILYGTNGEKIVKEIWNSIILYLTGQGLKQFSLKYVRRDSPTYTTLSTRPGVHSKQDETSPFIILPATWDEYLGSLERKQRHELKRKIGRLEKESAFHFCKDQTIEEDFHNFIRLHKLSDPNKDNFMTDDMEKFFWDMVSAEKDDWQIHFCSLFIDDKQVASVMAFMNESQTLLYNSGFDPAYSYYSVGLLVKAFLLKKSLEQGKELYDFLRGNERYKYDLGAQDLPLFQLDFSS